MKIRGEFVSLATLLNSLESNRRLYFLYKQATQNGSNGARLRFLWFRRSLPPHELREIELLFEPRPRLKRTA